MRLFPPAQLRLLPRVRRTVYALAACVAPALFGQAPLTLDDAIRLALANNQQIKVEAFGRPIARADLLAARGLFDPAITFARKYSEDASFARSNVTEEGLDLIRTDQYSLGLEGLTPWGLRYHLGGSAQNQRYPQNGYRDNFATFGGLTVTQPLLRGFGFGANLVGVRIARADRGIADWQFRQTAIDVVTNVITTYSDVAYAQQLLRIAQRSRELVAGLLAENEKRFAVGSISDSDVALARARTASREEFILVAQQEVRDAVNRLRQLIGETNFPVNPEALVIEPATIPDSSPVNPAEDLQKAYNDRPDYQSARLNLLKRRANQSAARSQMLPQVDFVGSYGYSGLDPDFGVSRGMVRNKENRSYSAGVVVSVPLTFAEGRGRARSAKLHVQQTEADLLRLQQDIALSIARAAGQIETTRQRVAADRTSYELAKQSLDAELKKLRAGTSSTFVVLNLQGELISAENSLYRAVADERRAHALYDRELGRTLTVRNIALEKQ